MIQNNSFCAPSAFRSLFLGIAFVFTAFFSFAQTHIEKAKGIAFEMPLMKINVLQQQAADNDTFYLPMKVNRNKYLGHGCFDGQVYGSCWGRGETIYYIDGYSFTDCTDCCYVPMLETETEIILTGVPAEYASLDGDDTMLAANGPFFTGIWPVVSQK